ncbi:cystathionine gamma-synthase [Fusarium oxysporum f. sp. phaseoli]
MQLPSPPPIGTPVPQDRHAVSVQLPTWQDMVDLGSQHPRIGLVQKGGYPRSFIHHHIQTLAKACGYCFGHPEHVYLFYPSFKYMKVTRSYILSQAQLDGSGCQNLATQVPMQVLGFSEKAMNGPSEGLLLYALLVPSRLVQHAMYAWRITGFGISSRLANKCLQHVPSLLSEDPELFEIDRLKEVAVSSLELKAFNKNVDTRLRDRLAYLQNFGRINKQAPAVTKDMVFLYPTGMTAIYEAHQLLLRLRHSKTVVFGFLYELTPKLLKMYGPGFEFFGNGTAEELEKFESVLQNQEKEDPLNRVQAVWGECASNPLLKTVDLEKLRQLADQYGFFIVVDDTIGSVANIDVLDVADIIVTSLTKSFSGYANVMAGSITLNPASRYYSELHEELHRSYQNTLFVEDAIQLELNSRDYLVRTSMINETASYLVKFLKGYLNKPTPLSSVYYPETCHSSANYRRHLRANVTGQPHLAGFGGLFTVEFVNIPTATAFFDALDVHKGPSLGAQYTLAQPYVQTVFQKEKAWAATYGLKETIVRISVGLEDKGLLKNAFVAAMDAAMSVYLEVFNSRRKDTSHAAHDYHIPTCYRSHGGTASIVDTPAQKPTASSKAGNGIQKHCGILGVLVGGEAQDKVPDDRARENTNHEDASLISTVAQVAKTDSHTTSNQIWRGGLELCFSRGPSEFTKHSRDKRPEALNSAVCTEKAPSADVCVNIKGCSLDVLPGHFGL